MKEQEVSIPKSAKFSLLGALIVVSIFLVLAGLAVQKADLSNPMIGKIFSTIGGILFSVSFLGMLIKESMKES